jgi:hypothetical protein
MSGSILGWGLLLATLWPRASQLYTGATLRFYFNFQDIYVGARISPEPVAFYILNVVVAFGVSIVILAIFHLIAHGLLLASDHPERSKFLPLIVNASFVGVFRLTWYVCVYLLIVISVYPVILLQHWLADRWLIGRGMSSVLLSVYACLLLSIAAFRYIKSAKFKSLAARDFLCPVILILLLYTCYAAVAETAYTVRLSTGQALYSKAADPYVEALITLGGATSAANDASVEVRTYGGEILLAPAIQRVEGSQYHVYFSTQALPPGEYKITLHYARASLTDGFPFWRKALTKTVYLSLVP